MSDRQKVVDAQIVLDYMMDFAVCARCLTPELDLEKWEYNDTQELSATLYCHCDKCFLSFEIGIDLGKD